MVFKRQSLTPRVILDLEKRSLFGTLFYILVICLVLFTDGYHMRHSSFSKLFLIMVISICLFRLVYHWAKQWVPSRLGSVNTGIFIASIALTALIWGLGFAWIMGQPGEQKIQLLMVICTVGLCSGGVVAYIPYLWLSIAFNVLILGPGIVYLSASQTNIPLDISLFLFSMYMVFIAIRGNNEYWIALENEFLLEERTRDLEKISNTDRLTGLYNRRYFDGALDFEWKRASRNQTGLAMIVCDIDHFKKVNDTFGHLAGDAYLRLTANRLLQVFKRKTDIVTRYGGEEFVVLMPDESQKNAEALAEKIRGKMESAILTFDSHSIQATISLGVAGLVPQASWGKEILISKADSALYSAKKKGRNQVVVYGSEVSWIKNK